MFYNFDFINSLVIVIGRFIGTGRVSETKNVFWKASKTDVFWRTATRVINPIRKVLVPIRLYIFHKIILSIKRLVSKKLEKSIRMSKYFLIFNIITNASHKSQDKLRWFVSEVHWSTCGIKTVCRNLPIFGRQYLNLFSLINLILKRNYY